MARTKSKHYVPYHIARAIAHENGIRSRKEYRTYRERNNALYLPFVPDRVYEEWEGWNAFLNTTNSFENTRLRRIGETKEWRQYWDAVRYAQVQAKAYNIGSSEEWREFYDEYEVPHDIPKRPEQVYEGFSWKVWLGKDIMSGAEAAKNVDKIVGLHPVVDQPSNVLKVVVWKDGYHHMVSTIGERVDIGMPVKMYRLEQPDDLQLVMTYLDTLGSKQYDDSYIVHNINQLFYELDSGLLIFTPQMVTREI